MKTNPPRPNKTKLKAKAFLSKHFECFKIVKSEHPGCDVSLHGASCPWLAYCLKQTYKTTQPRTSCHTSICKCFFLHRHITNQNWLTSDHVFRDITMLHASWVKCVPVQASQNYSTYLLVLEDMCLFRFKDGTVDEFCFHQTSLSC